MNGTFSTRVEDIQHETDDNGAIVPAVYVELPPNSVGRGGQWINFPDQPTLQRMDVRVGDTLLCERAGGSLLPHGVDLRERPAAATPVTTPAFCPACGAPAKDGHNGSLACTATPADCPAQEDGDRQLSHDDVDAGGPQ